MTGVIKVRPWCCMSNQSKGMLSGLAAVVLFSATLPVTRMTALALDPVLIAAGRILGASLLAAAILRYRRERLPERRHLGPLLIVCVCATIAFPLLLTWALRAVPSTHGIIAIAVLPLLTSFAAFWRCGERVSPRSWVGLGAGTILLTSYAFQQGVGELTVRDFALLLAILAAAAGFSEGGRLARKIGGWRVVSWALVLAGIPALTGVLLARPRVWQPVDYTVWAGWAYLSAVCSYVGYIPWFQGMALASVTDVSRLQLLQPFIALLFARILLGEEMHLSGIVLLVLITATLLASASQRSALVPGVPK